MPPEHWTISPCAELGAPPQKSVVDVAGAYGVDVGPVPLTFLSFLGCMADSNSDVQKSKQDPHGVWSSKTFDALDTKFYVLVGLLLHVPARPPARQSVSLRASPHVRPPGRPAGRPSARPPARLACEQPPARPAVRFNPPQTPDFSNKFDRHFIFPGCGSKLFFRPPR